jgi:nucleotide-binding universal stress UspA family protein
MTPTRKSVLVAVDFSEFSLSALETAREYVEAPSELCVVHVLPELSAAAPGAAWGGLDDAKRRRATEEALKEYVPAGYDGVQFRVAIGNPAREVARCAGEIGADLLVVASHGRTGFKRAMMGSVAEIIVRHAPCDVLVVHGGGLDQAKQA